MEILIKNIVEASDMHKYTQLIVEHNAMDDVV